MKKLCRIREVQRAIKEFESTLEKLHGICLNEGMALCMINCSEMLSSGEISHSLGLSSSNASKVIASIERKGFVERVMGTTDRRQMHFRLTDFGREMLRELHCEKLDVPEILKPILNC